MMRAELYTESGDKLLGRIEVPSGPICGTDFCESCADCMGCWPCGHPRVVYEDNLAEFLEEHEDAVVHMEES